MKQNSYITECSWDDIAKQVHQSNPILAKIIDDIDPGKNYPFVKVSYPYGSDILRDGKFCLPKTPSESISIDSPDFPIALKKQLSYRFVPVGLVLTKKVEVFFENANRIMPANLISAGSVFGLWQLFDPLDEQYVMEAWDLVAGARSVFMLAKISDKILHKNITNTIGEAIPAPPMLIQHFDLFKQIAAHASACQKWQCEILYFSKKWADDIKTPKMTHLLNYWLTLAWQQSYYCRRYMTQHVNQEKFYKEIYHHKMKITPYTLNTVNHVINIAKGLFPGFTVSTDDEALPRQFLTDLYQTCYLDKKGYVSIIMEPSLLTNSKARQIVYYSLGLPTLLLSLPNVLPNRSFIESLKTIKTLLDIAEPHVNLKGAFDYFHSEADPSYHIKIYTDIANFDSKISSILQQHPNTHLPMNSPFLHGCIGIKV